MYLSAVQVLILLVAAAVGQPPTVDYTQCSFPFGFNGVMNTNCVQNLTGVTDVNNQYGCFLPNQVNTVNRTGAICLSPSSGPACTASPIDVSINGNTFSTTDVCGWTVFMQRLSGSTFSWNRTWSEYKAGFGTQGSDFWLGLEQLYQLTAATNYRLRVEVMRSTGKWYSAEYWTFAVGDEPNTQYTLSVSGFVGGDSIYDGFNPNPASYINQTQNGMKFSTYDVDNDLSSTGSCSQLSGKVGWWYNNCWFNLLSNSVLSSNLWPFGLLASQRIPIVASRLMIKPQ